MENDEFSSEELLRIQGSLQELRAIDSLVAGMIYTARLAEEEVQR